MKTLLSVFAVIVALLSCVPAAYAQTPRIIDAPTIQIPAGSVFDASLASHTYPARFVSTLPTTCTAGEQVILTSVTPNLLEVCGASNTWTAAGAGGVAAKSVGTKLRLAATRADASNALVNPPITTTPAWAATTSYLLDGAVVSNNGNLYVSVGNAFGVGTSAGSGGPTGTAAQAQTDGGLVWELYQTPAPTGSNNNVAISTPATLSACTTFTPALSQNVPAILSAALNPIFTQYGATPFVWTGVGISAANATVVSGGNTAGGSGTQLNGGVAWVFHTDAPRVCILAESNATSSPGAGNIRALVDDAYVTLSGLRTSYGPLGYILLNFSSADGRKSRKITVEAQNGSYFGGVYVDAFSTVWPEGEFEQPVHAALFGNSILAGGGDNTPIEGDNIPFQLAKKLGWSDVWDMGEGGTDYQANNGGASYTYYGHIATDLARLPASSWDVVCFCLGGVNDLSSPSTEQAAALLAFQTARSAAPNAAVIVTGIYPEHYSVSSVAAIENAIYAAWLQFSSAGTGTDANTFFIPVSVGSNPGSAVGATQQPWISGLGYISATTGTGNADIYVGQDGAHQTPMGSKYLSERLAQAFRLLLPLIP